PGWLRNENVVHVGERLPIKRAARQCCGNEHIGDILCIRKVDPLVLGVLWMQNNIHQARQSNGMNLWNSIKRFWIQHTIAYYSKSTRALGDKDASIGQPLHAPRMRQSLCHHYDFD